MPIQTMCSNCGATLRVQDASVGGQGACPECGAAVAFPGEVLDPEDVAEPAERHVTGATDRCPCPACGEMIVASARKCRFCGEAFDGSPRHSEPRPDTRAFATPEAARRYSAQKQDRNTAIQIFATSMFACFSPIVVIYGIVFLLKRPYPFPCKGLAIAGTVIHGCWSLFLVLAFIAHDLDF